MNVVYKWLLWLYVHVSHFTPWTDCTSLSGFLPSFFFSSSLCVRAFSLILWLHNATAKRDERTIKVFSLHCCYIDDCTIAAHSVTITSLTRLLVCRGDWFCCSDFFFSLLVRSSLAILMLTIPLGIHTILSFRYSFYVHFLCIASMTTTTTAYNNKMQQTGRQDEWAAEKKFIGPFGSFIIHSFTFNINIISWFYVFDFKCNPIELNRSESKRGEKIELEKSRSKSASVCKQPVAFGESWSFCGQS